MVKIKLKELLLKLIEPQIIEFVPNNNNKSSNGFTFQGDWIYYSNDQVPRLVLRGGMATLTLSFKHTNSTSKTLNENDSSFPILQLPVAPIDAVDSRGTWSHGAFRARVTTSGMLYASRANGSSQSSTTAYPAVESGKWLRVSITFPYKVISNN